MLTNGFNHVAVSTTDLERKVNFYETVFGAESTLIEKMEHPPWLRHAFMQVGEHSVIHAVEDPSAGSMFPGEIGHRGPVDHLALSVPDRETLEVVRLRLMEAGASDGHVRDFGAILSIFYRDCDGMDCEVAWHKVA